MQLHAVFSSGIFVGVRICYNEFIMDESIITKIPLDYRSPRPIYQQIAENLQHLIVTEQLKAGEHLPSVRYLGTLLNISPNTVARAYIELEKKQVVISKRGGGTVVASGMEGQMMKTVREQHLNDNVNEDIIKILSQGYTPEELEAAFYTHLGRWREERIISNEPRDTQPSSTEASDTLRIVGSDDIALNILVALGRQLVKQIKIDLTHVGSLSGLIALQEEKADMSGIHLLDEETGEYNIPFIKRILPGREMNVVNLVFRVQGLMFTRGNPMNITGLQDLSRPDITFINRQRGSGTRILLDMHLKQQKLNPDTIKGYEIEVDNHLAVGLAIVQGKAEAGLGIEAAAKSCGLDFLPLFRERYDLVIPANTYHSEKLSPLLRIINSKEFKRIVNEIEGYDTSQTGSVLTFG